MSKKLTSLKGLYNINDDYVDFYCSFNKLTSLIGTPKTIKGDFYCSSNLLYNLNGGPEFVLGCYNCSKNKLTSLIGAPKKINVFTCDYNNLKNLKYSPINVGWFSCEHNKLTSLIGAPETISGNFSCEYNNLKSLKGIQNTIIEGDFNCSNNKLTSLDFLPENIEGTLFCDHNNWTYPIPDHIVVKYNIDYTNIYTSEQYEYFESFEFQKKFLTEFPEKYNDILLYFGYADGIKEEFDWLFNAVEMGLM